MSLDSHLDCRAASGINTIAAGNGATTISATNSTDTVTFKAGPSSYTIAPQPNGAWVISSTSTGEGPDTLTGITYASFADGEVLNLMNGQWSNGSTFVATASVVSTSLLPSYLKISISDSASNVVAAIDYIEPRVKSGQVVAIKLTDSGIPSLSLTAAQLTKDADALKVVTGYDTLVVAAPVSSTAIAGSASALGTTVVFSGTASEYAITPAGDGHSFTISGNGVIDQMSNVQALQFSDQTLVVAATPGTSSVTTGNVTELYSAVFGRLPDVPGLAYYQQELAANPSLSLTTLAQQFLASPEYTSNTAHNYAQTTAGDTQFITDLYTNLLHRAPGSGDAIWYEANVIAPIVGNATPGTAAYSAALAIAHAAVITGFSQSAEFLSNVQITATHPADHQHWLVLI